MKNISIEDDCNLAACGLIQLRGSAVLNENAIESINYYSDGYFTETPSKTVEQLMQLRASLTILMDVAKLPHQTAGIHPGIYHMKRGPKSWSSYHRSS
jgi:hypothetical protein